MKVLIVHNSYQQFGGEDAVVRNERSMLVAHGHEVHEYLAENAGISGFWASVSAAMSCIFSFKSYREIRAHLLVSRPDVVHVHNFFPLVSPSVFYACRSLGIPSVFTLHNFRIVCPTALLMHDGVVTERSLARGPWWAVRKRVYRGSLAGTFALALMVWVHRRIGTWSAEVTRFIALTKFAADKFSKGGLPSDKIEVKPNFVDIPAAPEGQRSGLLFVGRLSSEKGIEVLARAARLLRGSMVKVAGTGLLENMLRDERSVTMLGGLDSRSVYREMASAQALVMPSIWYEGFPMVLVEAYANGLPVIASRLGALAELVQDGVTGLLFEPGSSDDLADKMQWALDHPNEMARMGRAARQRYEERYTQEANYAQLLSIYEDAISASSLSKVRPHV